MQYKKYLHKYSHKNYVKVDTEGCAKLITGLSSSQLYVTLGVQMAM